MKIPALLVALFLMLTVVTGCGGSLEEDKPEPGTPPPKGRPPAGPPPMSTPTPTATPPGAGGVGVDQLATGVLGFSQSAGQYEISIQISDASLGLGYVESEGGSYALEPLIIGVRKADP